MKDLGTEIQKAVPQLFAWLGTHNAQSAGAPFARFIVVDMDKRLDIEVGVPVAQAVTGDSSVSAGVLPAGRYVSLTHFGNYNGLEAPNDLFRNGQRARDSPGRCGKRSAAKSGLHALSFISRIRHKNPIRVNGRRRFFTWLPTRRHASSGERSVPVHSGSSRHAHRPPVNEPAGQGEARVTGVVLHGSATAMRTGQCRTQTDKARSRALALIRPLLQRRPPSITRNSSYR